MLGDYQRATVTSSAEKGYGKRTAISEYLVHKRGGQGVFTITMTEKKGNLGCPCCWSSARDYDHVRGEGVVIRVKAYDISKLGRLIRRQGYEPLVLTLFPAVAHGCQQRRP